MANSTGTPPLDETLVGTHLGVKTYYGPPDHLGRRVSLDGKSMFSPGNDFEDFQKDGVRWVRLPDGREMTYEAYRDSCCDGSIECANSLNMLF